ncbi:MAG: hypothetical protein DBX55_05465 [Verrucomicrobia bacterium]|nr:MAG: hypothetical protein DBX55_05465 [Verrucomicrobiota bacterium]
MDFLNCGRKFLMLAPMSGYSDSPLRRMCRRYGADACVGEFVHSRAVLSGADKVLEKMRFEEGERPFGIQIFGSDEREMSEAAAFAAERFSPDFIDVNFGCPAHSAVGAGAGAALLRNVAQMKRIVSAVSGAVRIAVTAKMRTGWDGGSVIVPRAALELEEAGAKMITLHGRTKSAGYEGPADWGLIEKTAESLRIPLVGNGSAESLSADALRASACAGFMVGRAALGNPWVFAQMRARIDGANPPAPASAAERLALALEYAEAVCSAGRSGISKENLTFAKSQIMRFIKGCEGFKKLRVQMREADTLDELKGLICRFC